ncbi:hypothetical protein D0863_07915 [Hortaea werneckii]|uniref:Ribonuclease H2 subunit B n=1 Tax=Hortaea werneckii TaxID=91943 RepID=A0A3M7DTL9_HORWE|nr:hypothetical protein D0863_07915 [Hortaea werneckii]
MPPKTRSRKPTNSKSESHPEESNAAQLRTLEPSETNPPLVFVLPESASPESRILTLPNPSTSAPTRYLVDPIRPSFYEFTHISAPKQACRSWLLAPTWDPEEENKKDDQTMVEEIREVDDDGYVLQKPDLFIATPIDPLFLLLPVLWPGPEKQREAGEQDWGTLHDRLFLSGEENAAKQYAHLQQLIKGAQGGGGSAIEKMLEERMKKVCKVIDMGDGEDLSFSLDLAMLAKELFAKAERMVKIGLPASMEDKFVAKALEMPELSVRREESGVSIAEDATPGAEEGQESTGQSTATSQQTTTSGSSGATADTAATSVPETQSKDQQHNQRVKYLLRLRTALHFITHSYLPTKLRTSLTPHLSQPTHVDFGPLDAHLQHINQVKADAQALRSISDNIFRKRGTLDDDEAVEKAQAKKQKKEEEEAKKKSMSVGVKRLAKADTSGMKKMTSFFTKAGKK